MTKENNTKDFKGRCGRCSHEEGHHKDCPVSHPFSQILTNKEERELYNNGKPLPYKENNTWKERFDEIFRVDFNKRGEWKYTGEQLETLVDGFENFTKKELTDTLKAVLDIVGEERDTTLVKAVNGSLVCVACGGQEDCDCGAINTASQESVEKLKALVTKLGIEI